MTTLRVALIAGTLGLLIGLGVGFVAGASEEVSPSPVASTGDAGDANGDRASNPAPDRARVRADASTPSQSGALDAADDREAAEPATKGGGTVTVLATFPGGAPAPGVLVALEPEDPSPTTAWHDADGARNDADDAARAAAETARRGGAARRSARTADDGRVVIDGVGNGKYRVRAFSWLGTTRATPSTAFAGAHVRISVIPGVAIRLRPRLPNGRIPATGRLTLRSGRTTHSSVWLADEPVLHLQPGVHHVTLSAHGTVGEIEALEVRVGDARDVDLLMRTAPSIRGVVVWAPGVLARTRFVVHRRLEDGEAASSELMEERNLPWVSADIDGRFRISGLQPGRYVIEARNSPSAGRSGTWQVVEVGAGETRVELVPPAELEGAFLVLRARAPDGSQLSGTSARIVRYVAEEFTLGPTSRQGPDGVTRVRWPDAADDATGARYELRAHHPGFGISVVDLEGTEQAEAVVTFAEPARLTIDVEFAGAKPRGSISADTHAQPSGALSWGGAGTLSTSGVVHVTAVRPGIHDVYLRLRTKSQSDILAKRRIELVAGETRLKMTVPELHTLRLRCARGKQTGSLNLRRVREGDADRVRVNRRIDVRSSAPIIVRDLVAGTYDLRVPSRQEPIRVTVPFDTDVAVD